MAIHAGVGVVFSKQEDGDQRVFRLALSGGTPKAREEIIGDIDSALTRMGEEDSGEVYSGPELQTNDTNIWRAEWKAK